MCLTLIYLRMQNKKILQYYHPVLRKKAKPVQLNKETDILIKTMRDLLKEEDGVGLAAPQIGESKRVIIVNPSEGDFFVFLNPEIVEKSSEKITIKEGCLSLRGLWLDIERAKEIKIKFLDKNGENKEMKASGMLAIILQHEIDHLDGKLLIDRVGFLKRISMLKSHFLRRYAKTHQ